jgi:hypothetical protein
LDLRRHFRVHQRSTTICEYYLTGNPVCLRRRKDLFEQAFDLLGLCHVSLEDRAVRASLFDLAKRSFAAASFW